MNISFTTKEVVIRFKYKFLVIVIPLIAAYFGFTLPDVLNKLF